MKPSDAWMSGPGSRPPGNELHSRDINKKEADYPLACEVNTARQWFVTHDSNRSGVRGASMVGAFVRLIAIRRGFAGDLAAALPAKVAILVLCGRNQPQTATRIT